MSVKLNFKKDNSLDDKTYVYVVRIFFTSLIISFANPIILQFTAIFREFPVLWYSLSSVIPNVIISVLHLNTTKVIHNVALLIVQIVLNLALFIYVIMSCQ